MGVCYNPRVFTPARERLTLTEWHALQTFLFDAANINPTLLTSYQSPLDNAVSALRTLQTDARWFLTEVLPRVQDVGVTLADYGRDATQTFKTIVGVIDAGRDVGAVLSYLRDLQLRASANAAAVTKLFGALEEYLGRATQMASLLDAAVRGPQATSHLATLNTQLEQIATLTKERPATVNDASHGKNTWWIDAQLSNLSHVPEEVMAYTRFQVLNAQLQAELATARPSLEHVMGSWAAIAQELGIVIENARTAGEATFQQQTCLAEIALTVVIDEWNEVALDAASFADAFYVKR